MVQVVYPGVYVEEIPIGVASIGYAPTAVAAFVGYTGAGPINTPVRLSSFSDFEHEFGGLHTDSPVSYAVRQFYINGGSDALVVRVADASGNPVGAQQLLGDPDEKTGLYALLHHDFNLLAVPETFHMTGGEEAAVIAAGVALCEAQQAFYIVDAPITCTLFTITDWAHGVSRSCNAATYFPAVCIADPLADDRPRTLAPSGTLAGVYARTDATRGVWKAPAGGDANLLGVTDLALALNDMQNGQINPQAVNVLRTFAPHGRVAWGARTLRGSDAQADEYKYIPVRRLALFLEQSLRRGTYWAELEPNDTELWRRLRLMVENFLHGLWRLGAFEGKTPEQAYFVKCDEGTTTEQDQIRGVVNLLVGFAPLKPTEFLLLRIAQRTQSQE
jgi:phage tail sheath protein FI